MKPLVLFWPNNLLAHWPTFLGAYSLLSYSVLFHLTSANINSDKESHGSLGYRDCNMKPVFLNLLGVKQLCQLSPSS